MNNRTAIATSIAIVTLCLSSAAGAQAKPAKPAVCSTYTTLAVPGGKALVCLDGKRPSVWGGAWTEVTFAGHRYAVGFRSAK